VIISKCETLPLILTEKQKLKVFEKVGAAEDIWSQERLNNRK
jgi:hypothetical protein